MEPVRNPLLASLPCGRLLGVPFRVSLIALVVFVAALFSDFGPTSSSKPESADNATVNSALSEKTNEDASSSTQKPPSSENTTGRNLAVGLFVGLALLGSSLLHELAEVVVVRYLGGSVGLIVLWPAGGTTALTRTNPAITMFAAGAGLVVHALLCLICLPAVITAGATDALSLFSLPVVSLDDHWFRGAGLLLFSVNFKLFVFNFLPIPPLDGARLIRAWRASSSETGHESELTAYFWTQFGLMCSLAVLGVALSMDATWLAVAMGLVFTFCCLELATLSVGEPEAETVFGHDFSQGYTSLERDREADDVPREPSLGPIARWKAKRAAQKRQREREEREWAERELDRLLDKVSRVGMDGLTPEEKKTLEQVSSRFKQ